MSLILNFEGHELNEVVGVSEERVKEMATPLSLACVEIVDNYKQYSFEGGADNKDREGIHTGKILQRLLQVAENEQEQLVVIALVTDLIHKMQEKIAENSIKKSLIKAFAEVLAKM